MAKNNKRSRDYNEEEEQIEQWTQERENKKRDEINMNYSISIKCKSKMQKEVIQSIDEKDISIITGPPGSGKTYLSCAKALKFIKDEPDKYKNIVLIKSVNGPKDENIGFMKGTMEEKMEMHVYPFISNFNKVAGTEVVNRYVENGTIYVLPIMFALGVSLDNSIIIIDEAQQISRDNLRTLITRIGSGSKMIFLGDVKQKSVNKHRKSALEILMQYFQNIEEVGIIELTDADVVRHPVIKKLLRVFKKIDQDDAELEARF